MRSSPQIVSKSGFSARPIKAFALRASRTMIFLVDGDNNIGTGLQGADQLTADDSILIFYQKTGLALGKIKELCKGSKASIQYLESVKGGKNSIDFQIITELGVLVGRGEADCAYVISQDKGYEAAMSELFGHSYNISSVGNQHRRHCMAKCVGIDMRQIVAFAEIV